MSKMLQHPSATPSYCQDRIGAFPTANPLVTKLQRFVSLSASEVAAVDGVCGGRRKISAEQLIVAEGTRHDHVSLIVDGLACRYKFLPGGRRQILGYLMPGDLSDADLSMGHQLDHSIALLCDSQVVRIPVRELLNLFAAQPAVERAWWLAVLADRTILREWLLNIGQRDAYQKLSHLLCELFARLKTSGWINSDGSLELPLDQIALADTTGLTLVHVNRTLQRMRCEGLITLRRRRLTILDPARLAAIADFDDEYLAPQAPLYPATC